MIVNLSTAFTQLKYEIIYCVWYKSLLLASLLGIESNNAPRMEVSCMTRSISFSLLSVASALVPLFSVAYQEDIPSNYEEIRIVAVDPTPEGEGVNTKIIFPKQGELKNDQPIEVQIRLDGFPLRTYSQFSRAKEVLNYNKEGQSLHVVVDDEPYIAENEAIVNALEDVDLYYEQTLEFPLPSHLKPGQHVLRVFPARSYGESLKGDGCYAVRTFFVKSKTPTFDVDLHKPYITYNEPQGPHNADKKKPILLDFYVNNVRLSRDGYKVRVTIDGKIQRVLTKWSPYYIYGLKNGEHTLKLELLNETNTVEPGLFSSVERSFSIQ